MVAPSSTQFRTPTLHGNRLHRFWYILKKKNTFRLCTASACFQAGSGTLRGSQRKNGSIGKIRRITVGAEVDNHGRS